MAKNFRSLQAWETSQKLIPGGVNSPVRAFKSVGGSPIFIKRAQGSKIYDIDDNQYIDYVGSWGPLLLGHANPIVLSAISEVMKDGTSFGAPTELEVELANIVTSAVKSVDQIRMVNSGTEATMTAIRLARGYTNRNKIIKIEGCYHGHVDYLLVKAGSGLTTFGLPDSGGVPKEFAHHTLTVPFNDIDSVQRVIEAHSDQIACLILEPIAGNMGVIPPKDGYLEELRKVTAEYGIVLIFDEVMTGFRVAYGGAQELYGVDADLTCFGKIIGGGLPVGAYGGRKDIMQCVSPIGEVYQAGTLSGNPLAMAAGIATLKKLSQPGVYTQLEETSNAISDGMKHSAKKHGISSFHNRVGSMIICFFTDQEVVDYETAKTSDTGKFSKYFWGLLKQGVYIAPSQFEAGFVSLAHTGEDVENTIRVIDNVFSNL